MREPASKSPLENKQSADCTGRPLGRGSCITTVDLPDSVGRPGSNGNGALLPVGGYRSGASTIARLARFAVVPAGTRAMEKVGDAEFHRNSTFGAMFFEASSGSGLSGAGGADWDGWVTQQSAT